MDDTHDVRRYVNLDIDPASPGIVVVDGDRRVHWLIDSHVTRWDPAVLTAVERAVLVARLRAWADIIEGKN